ncbi:CLUMA_CG004849, isoform A [Clunio marinus]|uniref:CLUMA_CG004849, isoform A n=1 Tax=Clunio marinus TaxID=568069 RepID=A0A1J1HUX2_9DIPT|nr:CLUMA_CG004849, isoform A [Clunio marinus]
MDGGDIELQEDRALSPLDMALRDHNNGLSLRKGSGKYNLNHMALSRYKKNPETTRKTILTEEEESRLCDWILACLSKGFPREWRDVTDAAHGLLKERVGNEAAKLGYTWFLLFCKRHSLAQRTPEKLGKASTNLTRPDIYGWFERVHTYILNEGLMELLHDNTRVYNADETFFKINRTAGKVVAAIGTKYVYQQVKDEKAGLTVMGTFRADGSLCKPFIIYPYTRFPREVEEKFPSNQAYKVGTTNGWMDSTAFCCYLECLADEAISKGIKMPAEKILLFLDRHPSHMTLEGCETAKKLGIELICLYPNSTFLLQPADVGCFKPLKLYWREELRNLSVQNTTQCVSKSDFASVFLRAFNRLGSEIIKNAFRTCGIFPFNKEAPDYLKCLGKVAHNDESGISLEDNSEDTTASVETSYLYPDVLDFETAEMVVSNKFTDEQKIDLLGHLCRNMLPPSPPAAEEEFLLQPPAAEEKFLLQPPAAEEEFLLQPPAAEEEFLEETPPTSPAAAEEVPAFALVVPPTPCRSFKRNTKRTADVITSLEHIESMKTTRIEKEQTEIQKKARHVLRENNRELKAQKFKSHCRFCSHSLTTERGIEKHEGECFKNPNRATVTCPICRLSVKPSLILKHKKTHYVQNIADPLPIVARKKII